MNYLSYLSFYKLNRLRGTRTIWAKYIAIYIGVLFGLATLNPYIGIAMAVGYLTGEAMGWGEAIGGLIGRIRDGITPDNIERENPRYRIQWLTLKFSKIDTVDYYVTWLFIRGLYWWLPTLAALYWILDPVLVTFSIILLASWFPLSIIMAEGNDKQWNEAEKICGGIQNIIIYGLLIVILLQ